MYAYSHGVASLSTTIFNPIRPDGGWFSTPTWVNSMPAFYGWGKISHLLMVFQVGASINLWWNQIFGLLWIFFQNRASKTPSCPDFRAKNVFFHILSIFFITNHAFFFMKFNSTWNYLSFELNKSYMARFLKKLRFYP